MASHGDRVRYQRQLELEPTNAQLWLRYAECCVREGDKPSAYEAYLRAAEEFRKAGFDRRMPAALNLAEGVLPREGGTDAFAAVSGPSNPPSPDDPTVRITAILDLGALQKRRLRAIDEVDTEIVPVGEVA